MPQNSSTVTISLRLNNQGVITGLQQVSQQGQRTGQQLNQAGNQASASFNRVDSTLATVTRAFKAMQAALAALALYEVIKQIVEATLRLQAFNSAMTAITGSSTLAANDMAFVGQTANKLGLNLVALESSYKNLAGSAMGTSLAGEQTRKIFTAVAKASAVLGLSADQTKGSLYAIGQMMSKGTVQAEELKGQLAERLPGAFQLAAKAMGVTTSQLQKMLENGEVMATDMLPKLADELENRFGGAAEDAGETARASFERFKNAVENLKRALGESGILEFLAKMADLATDVMNSITRLLNGPTSDEKLKANAERLIKLRKEEAEATAVLVQQRAQLQDIGNPAWAQAYQSAEAQTIEVETTARQQEIATLEKENRMLIEQNKIKQREQQINQNQVAGVAQREKIAAEEIKITREKEKVRKEAEAAAKKAANEAKREAERVAREREQILQKAEDDYRKSTLAESDYLKEQLENDYQLKKAAGYDLVKLDRWKATEIQKIEDDRLKEFEKGFEAERDAYEKRVQDMKDLEEKRLNDALAAIEENRRAYKDFVADIQDSTSDVILGLFDGGFSSFFDELENKFKRLLADMAAQAIAEPIVVPVIQAIGGSVGVAAANSLGIPVAGSGAGGFNLSNIGSIYNAVSGGLETGVYKALTSGILNQVGSSLFGATAWGGAAGAELGWGATAAATTGMGTSGIAGAIASAAPWAAMVGVAVPLVMKLFQDDPEPFLRVQTTSTSAELSNPNYKWGVGEGTSPAGYDYNLTMQDTDSAARKELGLAVTKMLDAQFTAIEATLDVSINDAIAAAQARGGGYGEGFFSKIDLAAYSDDIAGGLAALSEDLFLDIRSDLTDQLTGGMSNLFSEDFFSGIAIDGESAVDTFLKFGQVVESTDNFMQEFTRQTEQYGESAVQAYANVQTISEIMAQMSTAANSFSQNSAVAALEAIDTAYEGLIATMKAANATVEQLNAAEQYRLRELGAAITGLTADSVASALWTSIQQNQQAGQFVQTLEDQVQSGVAQAAVNAFSQSLYSAFIQPINAAVGNMVSSIITGGMTTGAAISASMSTIKESLEIALSLMKNEEFKSLIDTFMKEVQVLMPNANTVSTISTPAPTYTTIEPTNYTADSTANDDATAILKSKLNLEEQLYSLLDDQTELQRVVTEQRQLELSALDESLRPLQERVWKLTDEAKITALAAENSEKLSNTMKDIRIAVSESGLSEYVKVYNEIQRNTEELTAKAIEYGASQQDLIDIQKQASIQIQEIVDAFTKSVVSLYEVQLQAKGVAQSIIDDQMLYYDLSKLFGVDYATAKKYSKQQLLDAFLAIDPVDWGFMLEQSGIEDATETFTRLMSGLVASLEADNARIESLYKLQADILGQSDQYAAQSRKEKLGKILGYDMTSFSDADIVNMYGNLSREQLASYAEWLGSNTEAFVSIMQEISSSVKNTTRSLAQSRLDLDAAINSAFGTTYASRFSDIIAAAGIDSASASILSAIKNEISYGAINEAQARTVYGELTDALESGSIGLEQFNSAVSLVVNNIKEATDLQKYQIGIAYATDNLTLASDKLVDAQNKFSVFDAIKNLTTLRGGALEEESQNVINGFSEVAGAASALAVAGKEAAETLYSSLNSLFRSGLDTTSLSSDSEADKLIRVLREKIETGNEQMMAISLSVAPAVAVQNEMVNSLRELKSGYSDASKADQEVLDQTITALENELQGLAESIRAFSDAISGPREMLQAITDTTDIFEATIVKTKARPLSDSGLTQEFYNNKIAEITNTEESLSLYKQAILDTISGLATQEERTRASQIISTGVEVLIKDLVTQYETRMIDLDRGNATSADALDPAKTQWIITTADGIRQTLDEAISNIDRSAEIASMQLSDVALAAIAAVTKENESAYANAYSQLIDLYTAEKITKDEFINAFDFASKLYTGEISTESASESGLDAFISSFESMFESVFDTVSSVLVSGTDKAKYDVLRQSEQWQKELNEAAKEYADDPAFGQIKEVLDIAPGVIDKWVRLKIALLDLEEMQKTGAARANLAGTSTAWNMLALESDFNDINQIRTQQEVYSKYMVSSWSELSDWMQELGMSAEDFSVAMQSVKESLDRVTAVTDARASILGVSDKLQLARNEQAWGLASGSLSNREYQQEIIDWFTSTSSEGLVEWTDSMGLNTEDFISDISAMAENIKATNNAFKTLNESLESYKTQLLGENPLISPDTLLQQALSDWQQNQENVFSSDIEKSQKALESQPSLSNNLLAAAKNSMTDQYEYSELWGRIYAATEQSRLYASQQITQSEEESEIVTNNWQELLDIDSDNQEILLKQRDVQVSLAEQVKGLSSQTELMAKSTDFDRFFDSFSTLFSAEAGWVASLRTAINAVTTAVQSIKINTPTVPTVPTGSGSTTSAMTPEQAIAKVMEVIPVQYAGGGEYRYTGSAVNIQGTIDQIEAAVAANYQVIAHEIGIPGYASGGYHPGGLALVGEQGPELINVGPSRIVSNYETRSMFDLSGILAELRALREENREMKTYLSLISTSSNKSRSVLVEWQEQGFTSTAEAEAEAEQ